MQVRIWNMILIACRLFSNRLAVLLLVFVMIALDAPDNLSTSFSLCLLNSDIHPSFSHDGLFL